MAQRLADDILDPAMDDTSAPPSSLSSQGAETGTCSSSSTLGKLDDADFYLTYAKHRVHCVFDKTVVWVENLVQKLSPFVYLFEENEEERVRRFVRVWEEGQVGDSLGEYFIFSSSVKDLFSTTRLSTDKKNPPTYRFQNH